MSSHREIAGIAGVSVATVSRALSEPEKVSKGTMQKVRAAIELIGYRPNMLAKSFRSHKANTVILLVPEIVNTFYANFIKGVGDQAYHHGVALIIGETRGKKDRELAYVERVRSSLADGVIQLRPFLKNEKSNIPPDIPCVNALGCEHNVGATVRINNRAAAKAITQYLISLGHRRIGVITGPISNAHSYTRLEGYKECLKEHGIEFLPELIVSGDFTMYSGHSLATYFCEKEHRATAIFCMNDEMAIGALQGLKQAGVRVPMDISVVGFDNIPYAKYCDPPLTTIAQPTEYMGRIAMGIYLSILSPDSLEPPEQIIPWELIVRGSSCSPS